MSGYCSAHQGHDPNCSACTAVTKSEWDGAILENAAGGDIIFTAGKSSGERSWFGNTLPDGNIVFKLADGTEFLRLGGDGHAYVRGEVVSDDIEVFRAFRNWLKTTVVEHASGTFGSSEVKAK